MEFTKAEIEEFKELTLKVYGVVLTNEEALDQGGRLIKLFEAMITSSQMPLSCLDTVDCDRKEEENG